MYNQQLINTVEGLKAKRIIKKDVDIANATGFSRAVVSNYLSGRVKASDNFIDAFESFYKVSVFENNVNAKPDDNQENLFATIKELARANATLSDDNKALTDNNKVLADSNSDLIKMLKDANGRTNSVGNPQGISAILEPYLQQLAAALAGKYGKHEHVWLAELNTIILEFQKAGKLSRKD